MATKTPKTSTTPAVKVQRIEFHSMNWQDLLIKKMICLEVEKASSIVSEDEIAQTLENSLKKLTEIPTDVPQLPAFYLPRIPGVDDKVSCDYYDYSSTPVTEVPANQAAYISSCIYMNKGGIYDPTNPLIFNSTRFKNDESSVGYVFAIPTCPSANTEYALKSKLAIKKSWKG
jgi:hypothetical protein